MKIFKDKERELYWVSFNKAKEEKCRQAIEEVNTWTGTPNISRFVVYGMECGDFFVRYHSNRNPAFVDFPGAEEKKELYDFLYFIYETENPNTVAGVTLLSNDSCFDELAVEYLVINPKLQNRGIGTRFIQSLKENMKVLSGRKTNNVITARVDKENTASIKLFSKVCKPIRSKEIVRNIYFTSREMEKED